MANRGAEGATCPFKNFLRRSKFAIIMNDMPCMIITSRYCWFYIEIFFAPLEKFNSLLFWENKHLDQKNSFFTTVLDINAYMRVARCDQLAPFSGNSSCFLSTLPFRLASISRKISSPIFIYLLVSVSTHERSGAWPGNHVTNWHRSLERTQTMSLGIKWKLKDRFKW